MDAAKGYYRNIGNDLRRAGFNPELAFTVSLSRAALEADIEHCIACFCCQEVCPEKAVP